MDRMVRKMEKYKLTVKMPEAYRKHLFILQGRMKKNSKDEVIRELIDKELYSLFSPSHNGP